MKKINRWKALLLCSILAWAGAGNLFASSDDTLKIIYDVLILKETSTILDMEAYLYKNNLTLTEQRWHLIEPLREYVKAHPNAKVEMLSELFINFYYSLDNYDKVDFDEISRIVRQTMGLNNKHFSANVFCLVGRIYSNLQDYEKAITYYYAASQDFKELGNMKFTTADYINFDISRLFYLTNNYKDSKEYGLKCYRDIDKPQSMYKGLKKVILLDLLGASYKKIGEVDSSLFYYRELRSELRENADVYTKEEIDLWTSIADGNIGEYCLELGKLEEAEPYILSYYSESARLGDTFNILLSNNLYAKFSATLGENEKAVELWRNILKSPIAERDFDLLEAVSGSLAQIFRKNRSLDSAFYYYNLRDYYQSRKEHARFVSELNRIKQNLEFSELSDNVFYYESTVVQVKNSNLMATLIIVLSSSLFLIILYTKRKNLQRELEAQKLRLLASEKELSLSQERASMIKDRLLERNKLAQYLIRRIGNLNRSKETGILINEIQDYFLTTEEGWERFKITFLNIYPDFIDKLEEKLPGGSPAEQRMAILIFLGLDNSEIGRLLGISTASVAKAKYRLKLSLKLDSTDSLKEHIGII